MLSPNATPAKRSRSHHNRWQCCCFGADINSDGRDGLVAAALLRNSETADLLLRDANGPRWSRFAAKLCRVLKNTSLLATTPQERAHADTQRLALFESQAATVRCCAPTSRFARVPARLAILESDVLMLISPGEQENQSRRT